MEVEGVCLYTLFLKELKSQEGKPTKQDRLSKSINKLLKRQNETFSVALLCPHPLRHAFIVRVISVYSKGSQPKGNYSQVSNLDILCG